MWIFDSLFFAPDKTDLKIGGWVISIILMALSILILIQNAAPVGKTLVLGGVGLCLFLLMIIWHLKGRNSSQVQ